MSRVARVQPAGPAPLIAILGGEAISGLVEGAVGQAEGASKSVMRNYGHPDDTWGRLVDLREAIK